MNFIATPQNQAIVIDEIVPHAPAIVWKALTSSALIARWLMPPTGFAAVVGTRFSFMTRPEGAWDGTIACEVLEVIENEKLSYSWSGGDAGNAGYGSQLDTVVTFTLAVTETGTRVRLEHAGFELPRNDVAYRNMGEGWKTVVTRLDAVARDEETRH